MGHRKYTVKQGDCISSIAFRYGFFPDTIWHDSKNDELRELRGDPNVLLPGDTVYIRDKEEREESCASEQKHRFRRKGVPEKLIVEFESEKGPMADEPYVLNVDGALTRGTAAGDGTVESWIPPNAERGCIVFPEAREEWELDIGHLDPIEELSGIQARLMRLGYYPGPVNGKASPELRHSVRIFQESNDLSPTGVIDEATRNKIQERSGG